MGLDSFKSEGTSTSNTQTNSTTSTSTTSSDGYYKTFQLNDGRKKVIKTEEEWNEIVEFVETQFRITEEELLNEDSETRYDLIHKAKLGSTEADTSSFYPKRECFVCGEVFSYPTNWSFAKYEGEVVCKTHKVGEVEKVYKEANDIQG